jgi:hypothetical protein
MDTGLRTYRHRFELSGGAIAKYRMTTGSIVEHFDPFKNILPCLFSSEIASMIHELGFQRMKEAFDHGIVPAVPTPTRARRQAVTGQQLAVQSGGVLGPAVRMMQHAARRSSVFHGHGERRCGQLLSQAAPHPPGNDPARVEIPALGCPDVRDVVSPHMIGVRHRKLTIERVRYDRILMRRIRGGPPLLDRLGADRTRTHETGDTVVTDPLALGLECRVNPGAAVGSPRLRVDRADHGHQPPIRRRPATLPASGPGIVARGRHGQRSTHHPDGEPFLMITHGPDTSW